MPAAVSAPQLARRPARPATDRRAARQRPARRRGDLHAPRLPRGADGGRRARLRRRQGHALPLLPQQARSLPRGDVRGHRARCTRSSQAAIDTPATPHRARSSRSCAASSTHFWDRRFFFALIHRNEHKPDDPDNQEWLRRRAELSRIIQRAVKEAIAAGHVRRIDPRIATEMLLGMLRGANRYRNTPRHARRHGRRGRRRVRLRRRHARRTAAGHQRACGETIDATYTDHRHRHSACAPAQRPRRNRRPWPSASPSPSHSIPA